MFPTVTQKSLQRTRNIPKKFSYLYTKHLYKTLREHFLKVLWWYTTP